MVLTHDRHPETKLLPLTHGLCEQLPLPVVQ